MIVINKTSTDDPTCRAWPAKFWLKSNKALRSVEMASVYSQGSQRNQGGDWGWVERSVLRKELADVAFTIKPGQVSDVIDTPEACYLMLVEEKSPAHIKPPNEVRGEIEETLRAQQQKQLEEQWIDRLKQKTFVLKFP